jgi:hypothetical protein
VLYNCNLTYCLSLLESIMASSLHLFRTSANRTVTVNTLRFRLLAYCVTSVPEHSIRMYRARKPKKSETASTPVPFYLQLESFTVSVGVAQVRELPSDVSFDPLRLFLCVHLGRSDNSGTEPLEHPCHTPSKIVVAAHGDNRCSYYGTGG